MTSLLSDNFSYDILYLKHFRKAGEFFDDEKLDLEVPIDRYQLPRELQDLLEDRLKSYNNLAMSQMKIEAWDSAMAALQQVLKIEVT